MQHLVKAELLAVLAEAKARSHRDWLMFLVAYHHGLRATEVVSFTRLAVVDGHITIQRLKGSLKTVQPLRSDADPLLDERAALETLTSSCRFDAPVFAISRVQFFRLFRKYAKLAGIPAHKRHPHVLKHTIAMESVRGAGIENVRQWLGHRSIASTGEYLRVTDAAAADAISRATHEKPKSDLNK